MLNRGTVKKSAFTMIEAVIYMSLVLILMFFLQKLVLNVREYALFLNGVHEKLLRKRVLVDLIRRDVMLADYMHTDVNMFVFSQKTIGSNIQEKDIGFCVRDKKVFRISGRYDYCTKKWLKKYSSLAYKGVESIVCKYGHEVTIKFSDGTHHVLSVKPKNRVI